jgi:similar to stage IV sporulation protein
VGVPISAAIGGYVRVRCETNEPALFIEQLKKHRLTVWDVSFTNEKQILLSMSFRHFLQVRKCARIAGCRISIIRKVGFPLMIKKLKRRKWWVAGIAPAIVILLLLLSLIWRIDITGNERISDEQVLAIAKTFGVERFSWRFQLADPTKLGKQMQRKLPGVSWVGVELRGVVVKINVVEAHLPQVKQAMQGHHIVSQKSAVVSHVFAERGKSLVKVNQSVKKGDVLISGWIGTEEHNQLVAARGMVKGFVWYDIHMKIPLQHKLKTMTGDTFSRMYAVLGRKAFQVNGYSAPPFSKFVTETELFPLTVAGRELPIGSMKETLREISYVKYQLNPAEAKRIAVAQARLHFLRNLSKLRATEVVIRKQQMLLQKQTKSHLHLRVFFEVEEPIGKYVFDSAVPK